MTQGTSALADLSTNMGDMSLRKDVFSSSSGSSSLGKSSGGAARTKANREDDKLPSSSRASRIEVRKDWDGEGKLSHQQSQQSQSQHRKKASSGSRGGDRFIPHRDLSRSSNLSCDHLLENPGGDPLSAVSGSRRSTRSSSPGGDRDRSENLTASSMGARSHHTTDDDDTSHNTTGSGFLEAPADLEGALSIESNHRILSFSAAPPDSASAPEVRSRFAAPRPKVLPSSLTSGGRRRIPTVPEKTLDTPGMINDFYTHLLAWSPLNNVAIALGAVVHVWNGNTGDVIELCDLETQPERLGGGIDQMPQSLSWDASGKVLAVGTPSGHVQLWDLESGQRLRTLRPDGSGGADAVSPNVSTWAEDTTFAVGYKSGLLREHDTRVKESIIRQIDNAHLQAVCGMEYRSDSALLATGGNDNAVKVWDRRTEVPKMHKEHHRGAVRAISWSPLNSSLLATGGGTLDKAIHFWNVTQSTRMQTIKTDSQITSLHWSHRYREIVSCHGLCEGSSEAPINVWAHPSCERLECIPAHLSRIAYSALSPDGQVLATVGLDESLKFWKIFENSHEDGGSTKAGGAVAAAGGATSGSRSGIRGGTASEGNGNKTGKGIYSLR